MPTSQPSLFSDAAMPQLVAPASTGGDTEDSYREFLRLNPWVIDWFARRALDLVERGYSRIGINMLCEVFRYEQMRSTLDTNSGYKINNNYAPYLARELMRLYPALDGKFEVRRSRADAMVDMTGSSQETLIPTTSIAAQAYDW